MIFFNNYTLDLFFDSSLVQKYILPVFMMILFQISDGFNFVLTGGLKRFIKILRTLVTVNLYNQVMRILPEIYR